MRTDLYEKEFGFPHQTLAVVAFKIFGEAVKLFWAVGPEHDPLVSVTEKHAHKGGTVAVVFLGHCATNIRAHRDRQTETHRYGSFSTCEQGVVQLCFLL